MTKLKIEDFPQKNMMRIEGLDYDYEFFRLLGKQGLPVGAIIEVIKRDAGNITLERRREFEKNVKRSIPNSERRVNEYNNFSTTYCDDDLLRMREKDVPRKGSEDRRKP